MNSQIFNIFVNKKLHAWDLWVNWQFTGFVCFPFVCKKQQFCTWQRMICFLAKPDGELGYTDVSLGKSWYQVASESLLARLTKVKVAERKLGAEDVSFQCLWCSVSLSLPLHFLQSVAGAMLITSPACFCPLVKTGKRVTLFYRPKWLDQVILAGSPRIA